jgi:enolase-phosphatase E1
VEDVKCILLDIEGTTTPVDFVYRVLFPYARARVSDFLAQEVSEDEARALFARFAEERARDERSNLDPPELREHTREARVQSLVAYVHWLMDQDRKSTPLKYLQGKIWEKGYRRGELMGQVFPDVPRAMQSWQRQNKTIAIYSSGSVLAQQLLFSHTAAGDLTRFIHYYFDTTVGAKAEPQSYRNIAEALRLPPSEIMFISDVVSELDSANSAGVRTLLCVRAGNQPQPEASRFPSIGSFDEILTGRSADA